MPYIDAEELMGNIIPKRIDNDTVVEVSDILRGFAMTPTADVEPIRHAHWVYKYQNSEGYYIYECSSCGRFEKVQFDSDLDTMLYCHCGAKMDEENKVNEN